MHSAHRLLKTHPSYARIAEIEAAIRKLEAEAKALRGATAKDVVSDYELLAWSAKPIRLSGLFGKKDELILIHNMGKSCGYCTMWADGFNGLLGHIEKRAAFVVASPDSVADQKKFAAARGWRFRMVSSAGGTLFRDMGFETDDDAPRPGVTTFRKTADGRIERYAGAAFGPGDKFCSVFGFLDLLPPKEAIATTARRGGEQRRRA